MQEVIDRISPIASPKNLFEIIIVASWKNLLQNEYDFNI